MIQVKTFVFNPFSENTYVIYDDTRQAIILDPGCYFPEEQHTITRFIADNKLKPQYIANTHGHIDHILGMNFLKSHYGIPVIMHPEDLGILKSGRAFGNMLGIQTEEPEEPDRWIKASEKLEFGHDFFHVYHVPGHSPGSIALYNENHNLVFAGDVLFKRAIGRTDLPGGNHQQLINSIKDQLLKLNNDTMVYPGHGETTTIGEEKDENPFLNTPHHG